MWRYGIAMLVLAAVLIGALAEVHRAMACQPSGDPVKDSDVIVEGRFVGYEVLPDAPVALLASLAEGRDDYDYRRDAYLPVRVDMDVARVYKGNVQPGRLEIFDDMTLSTALTWLGTSGNCSGFAGDPTGRYAILGLMRTEDGKLRTSTFLRFFEAESPDGESYGEAVARLAPLTDGPSRSFNSATVGVVIGSSALLAGIIALAVLVPRVKRRPEAS